ncbi:MAG: hypothetical protein C0407_19075, partial [Desulfobacca sp.]|nr:hypothetical protein [Desulfobacca sp.]
MPFAYLRLSHWPREGASFLKRRLCLLILPLIFFSGLSGLAAAVQDPPPQVIILNSYHPGFTWSDNELTGVIQQLRQRYPHIDPAVEYLDAKRFPTAGHLLRVKDFLTKKYRGQKFDLVIALDNPALETALGHRQELFPGTPIVFGGINNFTPSMLAGQEKVTGVAEVIGLADTLNIALSLHPQTEEVFVVHDYTMSGLASKREIEALLPAFRDRVHIKSLSVNN